MGSGRSIGVVKVDATSIRRFMISSSPVRPVKRPHGRGSTRSAKRLAARQKIVCYRSQVSGCIRNLENAPTNAVAPVEQENGWYANAGGSSAWPTPVAGEGGQSAPTRRTGRLVETDGAGARRRPRAVPRVVAGD